MQKNKLYLFLILLLSTTCFSQANLTNGLVAYYPFNGNTNDESGNNNNPSKVNATFTADRFGKPNAACAFNGKNNFIQIPDDASLHFKNSFSISAWVMVNGFYEGKCHGNRIIMKGRADIDNGNYLLTFDDAHYTNDGNCFTDNPDKKHQSFYGPYTYPFTDNYIVPGKWYLLTLVTDGRTANLYVDCTLYATGPTKNYIFSNTDDLFFGKMNNAQYPYWFNGLLDEVRIYNRALTKDEIQKLCDIKNVTEPVPIVCTGKNVVPATFTYTQTDCSTVSFKLTTATTKNIKAVQWSFGDGANSDKPSPVHTYKKYGDYKVRSIVTSVTGCKDTVTSTVKIQELKTDFIVIEQDSPGEIQVKAKTNKAAYSWSFDDGSKENDAAVVSHTFTESRSYKVQMFAQNNSGCKDTVEKTIAILLPQPILTETTTTAIIQKETIDPLPPVEAVKLEQRTKDVVINIPVQHEFVNVSLYDNGIIDGDSITLVYNGEVILSKQVLNAKPLNIRLKMDTKRETNELVMYAENLGSIPPNTALMIINDGDNRHSINVSSTKISNGTIWFTPKK